MGWESRLSRLKTLFGEGNASRPPQKKLFSQPSQMCFQVVICYMPPETNDPEIFATLCAKYGIEAQKTIMVETFEVNYGQLPLPDGFLCMENNGDTEAYEPVAEAIYTTTNRAVINQMLQKQNLTDNNPFFDKIINFYKPAIEKKFPGIKCKGTYTDLNADSAITFQFVIQPYKPELCKPDDIGILKPITIIDDHTIYPERDTNSQNFSFEY